MMLTELTPRFLKLIDAHRFDYVDDIKQADGLVFLCPKCFADKNNDGVGVHSVICWQLHVAPEIRPAPGRWKFEGTGFHDLTLVASSSSISLKGGCAAHFFIRNGQIDFA